MTEPPQFSDFPSLDFARHFVYSGTVAIVQNGGFVKADDRPLNQLARVHEDYIKTLFERVIRRPYSANVTTTPSVYDVLKAFGEMKIELHALDTYTKAVRPFPLPTPVVPSFPAALPESLQPKPSQNGAFFDHVPKKKDYEKQRKKEDRELLKAYIDELQPAPPKKMDEDEESICSATSSDTFQDDLERAMKILEIEEAKKKPSALDFAGKTLRDLGFHKAPTVHPTVKPDVSYVPPPPPPVAPEPPKILEEEALVPRKRPRPSKRVLRSADLFKAASSTPEPVPRIAKTLPTLRIPKIRVTPLSSVSSEEGGKRRGRPPKNPSKYKRRKITPMMAPKPEPKVEPKEKPKPEPVFLEPSPPPPVRLPKKRGRPRKKLKLTLKKADDGSYYAVK
ncbi:hypothetical protein L596_018382 [Steinernema carpocapsae]|uniref:Uncharacterized protein n=1 Tax=Steinernema carpocapsae TaxID=34508 RepID=A0A4U5N4I2_STECR|nr:hypothetical protein L596_018382 [Steinernema carpocapsae]